MTSEPQGRLPNADRAVIEESKVRDYLLASGHSKGGSKAAFFASLGYTQSDWRALAQALRDQLLPLPVTEVDNYSWGAAHVIVGELTGPNGRTRIVRSVWIIETNKEDPRLVTAYPQK